MLWPLWGPAAHIPGKAIQAAGHVCPLTLRLSSSAGRGVDFYLQHVPFHLRHCCIFSSQQRPLEEAGVTAGGSKGEEKAGSQPCTCTQASQWGTLCAQEASSHGVSLRLRVDKPALASSGPRSCFDDAPGPGPASRLYQPGTIWDPAFRRVPVWFHAQLVVALLNPSFTC